MGLAKQERSARTTPAPAAPGKSLAGKQTNSRSSAREPVAAAMAKTHFLQLLNEIEVNRKPIVITKRGRVVAHLVPPPEKIAVSNFDRVFGCMKGTGRVLGDIVSSDWESWGLNWH